MIYSTFKIITISPPPFISLMYLNQTGASIAQFPTFVHDFTSLYIYSASLHTYTPIFIGKMMPLEIFLKWAFLCTL